MKRLGKGSDADAGAGTGVGDTSAAATVDRVVGTGVEVFTLARERAAALRAIAEQRLCVPERVVMRSGGDVVATSRRIDGLDLGALLGHRAYLSVGECVYLGQQLCGALAALHDAGLAHGDISAANVMISRAGVAIVDTVAGSLPQERGTEGFRAPERAAGATAAADVYSVGAVLAACVDPHMRQGFMGWLDPLLDADPLIRPSARGVAAGLGQCATAVQIRLPELGLVGQLRARAHEPRERTSVLRSTRPFRMRRALARGAVAAMGVLAVVGVTGGVVGHLRPAAGAVDARESHASAAHAETPAAAARELTNARFAALAAGDGDALVATGAPASPVEQQLRTQAEQLAAGNLRFDGVAATVTTVAEPHPVANPALAEEGLSALVDVTYVVAAHTVWQRDPESGQTHTMEVESHSEVATLELWRDGPTWLVARVLPQS